ncbi:MAG: TspO/MBR family protein [Hyphomicrobiaceae bacterium]
MIASNRTDLLMLAAFVIAVGLAAAFGAAFKPGPWYQTLAKPSWTPPNAVFAPVWTLLYVMIAIAGWLVWRQGLTNGALATWVVALVLNAAWSYLFFGRQQIGLALADISLLWCAIVAFILLTRTGAPTASLLFVPYVLWVSFAAALNLAIWRLNA